MNEKSIVNSHGKLIELLVYENNGELKEYMLPESCTAVPYLNNCRFETNGHVHPPLIPRWDFEQNSWVDDASSDILEKTFPISDTAAEIRSMRNSLLSACDWTVLPDSPLSEEKRILWLSYRQSLRDIPQQAGFPLSVSFPNPPEL